MASKKQNTKQDTLSKSRRTAKSWTKSSSEKQFYEKKTQWDEEEDAVPNRAVSMIPRLKSIQHKTTIPTQNTFEGWVIDSTGRSFIVERLSGGDEHSAQVYDCVVSRSIVSENPASTLVAVGDRVICRIEPVSGTISLLPGVIVFVKKRKTKLARESAGRDGMEQVIVSNVDQVVILMSAADPFYNRRLIDRYLIAIELGDVEPIICINKMDLMDENFVREDVAMYAEHLGVKTLFVSAEKRKGLEELQKALQGKTTVFSGPSGVGKSTVVNLLLGEQAQTTTEVSTKTQKGLHTTTFSKVFRLPSGGYVLDTPGIREFGIWGLDKEDLAYYFHDFDADRLECKFAPCTHTHEPGCAIKAALEEGAIDPERYASYLNIFETLP